MKSLILLLFTIFALQSRAQVLLVSDVDDTLRLAHVQNVAEALRYSWDDKSRFLGMAELMQSLVRDNPSMTVAYLSNAPEWYMGRTHKSFLRNGKFPGGFYIPRTDLEESQHKLVNLRLLIRQLKPKHVILWGDDGQWDPDFYHQIVSEFSSKGVQFYQFIRIVYSQVEEMDVAPRLYPGQVGFVSPLEVSLELEKAGFLSESSLELLIETLAPAFSKPRKSRFGDAYTYPEFVDCSAMTWSWDEDLKKFPELRPVRQRMSRHCNLNLKELQDNEPLQ